MPSEAYGFLHENASLYDKEQRILPFCPRKYTIDVEKDLEKIYNIHETKISTENSIKLESFINYDRFAETYYSNQDLEKYVRIVRAQIKNDLDKDIHFKIKQYNQREIEIQNETVDYKKEKNEELKENFVCPIKNNKLKKIDPQNFGHEWCNPPKNIFKPFLEVKLK